MNLWSTSHHSLGFRPPGSHLKGEMWCLCPSEEEFIPKALTFKDSTGKRAAPTCHLPTVKSARSFPPLNLKCLPILPRGARLKHQVHTVHKDWKSLSKSSPIPWGSGHVWAGEGSLRSTTGTKQHPAAVRASSQAGAGSQLFPQL